MNGSKWLTLILTFSALGFPGIAIGQGAAGDQYTEQIPGASGSGGSANGGDVGGSTSDPAATTDPTSSASDPSAAETGSAPTENDAPLNSGTVDKFRKGGADGAAAANLAGQTAPDSQALRDAAARAQAGKGTTDTAGPGPQDSSGSDEGMGVFLPILLLLVLLAGAGYVWTNRRNEDGDRSGSAGVRWPPPPRWGEM